MAQDDTKEKEKEKEKDKAEERCLVGSLCRDDS
jgi:hypothetical protein